jgi:excisionase family DNA binding protein
LLDKFRRAHRNSTGTHFSSDELRALAEYGLLHILAKAEADELLAECRGRDAGELSHSDDPPENLEVYSVRTLAERWGCSHGLVRNMIRRGELRSFRYGNLIRIRADAVAEVESKRG